MHVSFTIRLFMALLSKTPTVFVWLERHKKSVENLPVVHPRYSKALALPISVEWTTSEPTPYEFSLRNMLHTCTKHIAPVWVQLSLCTNKCGCEKSHPRTSTVAISVTEIWICEIQSSQRQASSKRLFTMSWFPAQCPHRHGMQDPCVSARRGLSSRPQGRVYLRGTGLPYGVM